MAEAFAETEVLVAVMDGDLDRADELLDGFLLNELRRFEDQAHLLGSRIRQARRRHAEKEADRG